MTTRSPANKLLTNLLARLLRRVSACALLLAPVPAQRLWVVDPQNRPGTDFTSLAPAVAAANDGDAIRVRGGTHAPGVINKGISLLGEESATLAPVPRGRVRLENIAPGLQLVIQGFLVPDGIEAMNCRGRVLVERLSISGGAILVTSVDHLVLNAVNVTAAGFDAAVQVSGSTLVLIDCRIVGMGMIGFLSPTPALAVTNSFVHISRGTLTGGGASQGGFRSAPGITVAGDQSHNVVLAGDANTVVAAGFSTQPVSAIQGTGFVTHDPRVRLISANGAPGISASVQATATSLPSLKGIGVAPGNVMTVEVSSPVGDTVVFASGLVGSRIPFGAIGDLWIDPNLLVIMGSALQGVSEHTSLSLPVPPNPYLAFIPYCWQAASGTMAGFRLSNPVMCVYH